MTGPTDTVCVSGQLFSKTKSCLLGKIVNFGFTANFFFCIETTLNYTVNLLSILYTSSLLFINEGTLEVYTL